MKLAAGRCTPQEHAAIVARLKDATPEERQQVASALEEIFIGQDQVPPMPVEIKERVRAVLDQSVREPARSVRLFAPRLLLRYAAAVAVVLIGAWWTYTALYPATTWTIHATAQGQRQKIQAPDGSTIWMNAGTTIRFPEKFEGGTREVFLSGEAFFEVARDEHKPFIVHTPALDTRVLGTSFNIQAYAGTCEKVSVLTGKVQVAATSGNAPSVALVADQETVFDSTSGQLLTAATQAAGACRWKDGILYLDGKMRDVIPVLERWYDVKIQVKQSAIENCTVQARFVNEPLVNVLESMHYFLGVEYTVRNKLVFINGNGCP